MRYQASILALVLALTACTAGPGKVPGKVKPPTQVAPLGPVGGGSLIGNNGAALAGTVRMPAGIISQNGGNLISDNGLGLVSEKGQGLISDNGLGLVSNNGGGLTGKTKYALQAQELDSLPMAKVKVVIVGADGQAIKDTDGQPYVAVTDEAGAYHFAHTPTGGNFVVRVLLPGPVGDMRAFLPKDAPAGARSIDVDFASTLVVGYVLDTFVKGDASVLDRLPGAEEALARQQAAQALGERLPAANFNPDSLGVAMGQLRAKSPALDAQIVHIRTLLIAGQSNRGDGLQATEVPLNLPSAVAFDKAGRMAIADRGAGLVRLVETDGRIQTLAGTGDLGFHGDGGPATAATLMGPEALLFSPDGRWLYVADAGNFVVRRIDMTDPAHRIETVAGTGKPDGGNTINVPSGPAKQTPMSRPTALAWDADGQTLLIADAADFVVWRLTTDGQLKAIAGRRFMDGFINTSGGRPLTDINIDTPTGVAVDPATGRLSILVSKPGGILDAAPDGLATYRAVPAGAIEYAHGLVRDAEGALFAADRARHRIVRIGPDGAVTTVIGQEGIATPDLSDGPADAVTLGAPESVALDLQGRLVVADTLHGLVRRLENGRLTTIAGVLKGLQSGLSGSSLALSRPGFAVLMPDGGLAISDTGNAVIRRRAPDGTLGILAGTGVKLSGGDGGPASAASFAGVTGLVYGPDGTLYLSDVSGSIRAVAPDGTIRAVATGLDQPGALAVDAAGRLYATEVGGNSRLVSIGPDGQVTPMTAIGDGPSSGDGGPAAKARLHLPGGLCFDAAGDLYICDILGQRIRKIAMGLPDRPISTVFASTVLQEPGGEATDAPRLAFGAPVNVVLDHEGRLLIADGLTNAVLRVNPDGTDFQVIAGPDGRAFTGSGVDDGLQQPIAMVLDAEGDLFITDSGHNQIKLVGRELLGP